LKSEIAENVERWNNTLIGYVMGVKKNFLHLKACVSRIWKPKRSFDVYSRVNGYFFFKFGMKEDCVSVLHEEPWHFDGRLIIPKRWNEKLGMERDLLSSIPVWIKFPSLPLCLWSEKIISETASLICKPLYRDKATASGKTLALARCFVEIAATSKRPSRKMLEVEGDMEELQVEYEWIPPLCNKCSCFGLVSSQCLTIQGFFFMFGDQKEMRMVQVLSLNLLKGEHQLRIQGKERIQLNHKMTDKLLKMLIVMGIQMGRLLFQKGIRIMLGTWTQAEIQAGYIREHTSSEKFSFN